MLFWANAQMAVTGGHALEINESQALWLVGIAFLVIVVGGYLLARYGNNKTYEAELMLDQIKDYFIMKHECKDCNHRLKRIKKEEFLKEGWTGHMGTYSYSKQYKVTYFLKCSNCNRLYTSKDI